MSTVQKSFQRRFVLDRKQDATGTSGTGIVAEGIMFSNGKVALTWFSHYGAVNVYDSIEVVRVAVEAGRRQISGPLSIQYQSEPKRRNNGRPI